MAGLLLQGALLSNGRELKLRWVGDGPAPTSISLPGEVTASRKECSSLVLCWKEHQVRNQKTLSKLQLQPLTAA